MMHNSLFLNRLIIITNNGKIAYDEIFHKGVNIIRGENSSGKSTITHFIFYVLGGAFNDWVKEARQCSYVIAEVELNGAPFVLKRYLKFNQETGRFNDKEGLYILWGTLNDLENPSKEKNWLKFNFSTTEDRSSFSNVLFENLNLPIVKGENNITFHQILRLLYVDQDSPTSSLFFYEQFDSSLTRETVADLLLGVYNQELYNQKQRKIDADKELDEIRKEIRVIKKFIPNPLDLIPAHILTKIEEKQVQIFNIEENLLSLKTQNKTVRYTHKSKLEFEELNAETINHRNLTNELDTKIRSQKFEIEDSQLFIESLEAKLKAIKNSILARQFLGEFPLEFCPECLTDLNSVEDTKCKLCKEDIDSTFGVTKAKKIEQELSFQIKESKNLLNIREKNLSTLVSSYESQQIKLHQLQIKVNQALNDVRSFRDEKIDQLYVDKGFVEGEIIQLRTLLENAELYQNLVKKQVKLETELSLLNYSIRNLIYEQEKLKVSINSEIEKIGLYLLNNDLKRQRDFFQAKEFNIDYRNNIAFISDKDAKYSASSNFYLKTSARYSIFFASLEIERMRYPRFIFCDNMEDKGIEKERAQNFQRLIVAKAQQYNPANYQLIYTTSFIPEEFDNSELCVGEFYSESNPSLKNINV